MARSQDKVYAPESKELPKGPRGEITTFSAHAVKRLRKWLLLMHVPGCFRIVEGTLTIPGEVTPEEWRKAWHHFTVLVHRAGAAMVWRVELQRRGQPHVHFIGYAPTSDALNVFAFSDQWLRCLPERCRTHKGASRYSLHAKLVTEEDIKWLSYAAGHSSKKKTAQLGWLGKQWGIVGRKLFVPRPCVEMPLTAQQDARLRRVLRSWLRSKLKSPKARKRCRVHGVSALRIENPRIVLRLMEWAVTGFEA